MDAPTLFDHQEIQDHYDNVEVPDPMELVRQSAGARLTDPETSRQAARSISRDKMRKTQRQIIEVLTRFGSACDEDIQIYFSQLSDVESWPLQSPSGLRSRRAELVKAGLIVDSGERSKTSSGRQTIVWELKNEVK